MPRSLCIQVKKSKWLFCLLVIQHLVAIGVISYLSVFFVVKIIFWVIIAISFYVLFKKYCVNVDTENQQYLFFQNQWWKQDFNHDLIPLALYSSCCLSTFLIILNFKEKASCVRYSLLLFPDSEHAETLRKLRFILSFAKDTSIDR